MFWASLSRAAETPSRDIDVRFNKDGLPGPGGLPILVSFLAVPQQDENVVADRNWIPRRTFGRSVRRSDRCFTILTPISSPHGDGDPFCGIRPCPRAPGFPLFPANLLRGEGHGAEMAVNWKPASRWTLSPGFAYLQMHFHAAPTSTDTTSIDIVEGSSPREQAQLRSHVELSKHWEWDASAYFVGPLPALQVPAYTRLDTSLTWRPRSGLSISVVGQNCFRTDHRNLTRPPKSSCRA